jgi:hypothetical protein
MSMAALPREFFAELHPGKGAGPCAISKSVLAGSIVGN